MEILESGCLIILGKTNSGRVFRPSDWDQRLCCSISTFEDGRLTYSKYVRPIHKEKDKGVFVAAELKKESPELWDFVVNFAKADLAAYFDRELHDLCKAGGSIAGTKIWVG